MAVNPLHQYNILIVDSDLELSHVLSTMLGDMGFKTCDTVSDGAEAYRMLKNVPYDFLITEWHARHMDGIDLIRKIRRAKDSPNPTMPVIMLTGRSEQSDVMTARDTGINEFVVKPFSAKTVYNRIERIIENPRQFVVSEHFVGPNRRARGVPPKGMSDRRVRKIQPQIQPHDVHGAMHNPAAPHIWLPDFSLKYKIAGKKLSSLITDAVLQQAQAAVDAISDASLGWVKTNLSDMRILVKLMASGEYPTTVVTDIGDLALTINSRAGTFGYSRASEIAYLLYLFCRNSLQPTNKDHVMIVQKHMDVLHVILGNQMKGSAGDVGDQLAKELKKLADKYTT